MKTELFGRNDIEAAAAVLRRGGLVAVPTETVYGLCGAALDERAVREIYEVKGRPEVKPLSLMVHSPAELDRWCRDVPPQARLLAAEFLPGPLTIVLRAREVIPAIVRAGGDTVGIRCPDHPLTLALLRALDRPLAGPSANPSGRPSPKNAAQVLEYFDGKIDGVLDGGECGVGVESTVVDMSRAPYRVLRPGALGQERIADALLKGVTVIGLTGGTGSGKTTALEEVRRRGGLVIDCDAVYHELLGRDGELLCRIGERFPGAVSDGVLDRKALGAVVFADARALGELNAITHGFVRRETVRRLREWAMSGGTLAAIDAVALIESGLDGLCTATAAVTAPREKRIERLLRREGISREYAELRIDAQPPDSFYAENCEYILENNGTWEEFARRCRDMLDDVTRRNRDV